MLVSKFLNKFKKFNVERKTGVLISFSNGF